MLFESLEISFVIESFDFDVTRSLENTTRFVPGVLESVEVSFRIESFDFYGL